MDIRSLIQRFPCFAKPSYEMTTHKKVSEKYDIQIAVPFGKRAYVWFTYHKKENVCCIIEIGKMNKLHDNFYFINWNFPKEFALGTLLSGYIVESDDEELPNQKYFIADDIYCYKGYDLGNPLPIPFYNKVLYFVKFFKEIQNKFQDNNYSIHSVIMWKKSIYDGLPNEWKEKIGYNVRHIQYKSSFEILPSLNFINKNPVNEDDDSITITRGPNIWKTHIHIPIWNLNLKNKIYQNKVLFKLRANISHDVYYVYTGDNKLYQYACVPDYKTSVFLNRIFRKIPENNNIDLIEDSDNEEEFENIDETKHVDLEKEVIFECKFHKKFKKWIPLREKPSHLYKFVPQLKDLVVNDKR